MHMNGTVFSAIIKKDMTTTIDKLDHTLGNSLNGSGFSLSPKIDQLLKWAPIVAAFFADLRGEEPKKEFLKRLKLFAVSEGVVNGIVEPIKRIVHRRRPGSFTEFDSFPSGHTATSFLGAEMLRQAAKDKAPALAYAGYTVAIATAFMRVYKKKHWLSDVIAGAVLGIIAANIATYMAKRQANHTIVLPV